jgi:FkbM family methyltransferase
LKRFISRNKYGSYCVPDSSRHRPAAQKILANDIYEPETIEFMIANCGEGDIVHAGTYFGDFLPALAGGCGRHATIWAFEPNPENYACARITLQINDIRNVVLTNAGLGEQQGQLSMLTTDEDGRALGGASRIVKSADDLSGAQPVQIVRIDDMIGADRIVSIIQLDVEGHEREALDGALQTIRRCRPILILEVLSNSKLMESDWFASHILSLGYCLTDTMHRNSVFRCKPESIITGGFRFSFLKGGT